jgi:hypothetical protein
MSYDDIARKDILTYNPLGRDGQYAIYVVSIRKNDQNKYVDSASCDQLKAIEMLPSFLNYMNFARKNERQNKDTIFSIYLYNISRGDNDDIFDLISYKGNYKTKDLPLLIVREKNNPDSFEVYIQLSKIKEELLKLKNKIK